MIHAADIHVGWKIKQRRWIVGMTQQQLVTAIGLKFQQILNYESRRNRAGASKLWEISKILDVSPIYFFEGLEAYSSDHKKPKFNAERGGFQSG